jgi:RNA polymerase sigma-70 factor (ECF subfamily)
MTTSGARSHEARSAAARAQVASSHAVGARGLIDRDEAGELDERASELELVARCVRGDGAAAHALHERYYPAAAAFLRKLGARPDEMEDACQEVFLQFFRYLPSFRGESQIKTWLFRLCISEARRARRRRRVRATLATLLGRELPQETVVPPATASEATLRRQVETGLDRLSEGHRLVFVLLEMEGLPANQVAELARCSEATVWRRVGEVRRRCREMLGLGSDPPPDEESA